MEKRIRSLFAHLSNSPAANIDLVFWAELTGEDVLSSLSHSGSRWLSWLRPLEKIQSSYLSLLAHLLYQFTHHANKDRKKVIQWVFLFFCDWEFRLTVAGCVDVLRICFHTKNKLENAKSLTAVNKFAKHLNEELEKYCRKHSILAEALAGDQELPPGGTEIEKIADLYRRQCSEKLRLTYAIVVK